MKMRTLAPSDYSPILSVVDSWWGRPVSSSLPRLFFDHFYATSLVASLPDEPLAGFLIGFLSPSVPTDAYIHFVGVSPSARGTGIGRSLYAAFFSLADAQGRSQVSAITSVVNSGSIAFHRRLGFSVSDPIAGYDGPGKDMVKFTRPLRGPLAAADA
jgi:ribosomal protein S18 acetylase RimI-like enzyme